MRKIGGDVLCLKAKNRGDARFMSCQFKDESDILFPKGGHRQVDQTKIGMFFRELRKDKGLTQEQLAEHFGVSRRTVSRWETGSNMPDLDILIEMADYYEVELRELLDGEREGQRMDKNLEETVLKVADYSNEAKQKFTRNMHILFIGGLAAAVLHLILMVTDHADNFLGGFCQGITLGMMIVGVIITSRFAARIRLCKKRLLTGDLGKER